MSDSDPTSKASSPKPQACPNRIIHGDNLEVLPTLARGFARLVYIDPPFNTGRDQKRDRIAVVPDADGDRTGFGGRRYRSIAKDSAAYADRFDDYLTRYWPTFFGTGQIDANTGIVDRNYVLHSITSSAR